MRNRASFRTRLLLSFWVVLLLALLLPPSYYYRILTRQIMEETQRDAIQQLNLVHWMVSHEKGLRTIEELNTLLVEIGKQSSARITYVADGGRVIADSQVPFSEIPNLESHAARPEYIEARGQGLGVIVRFSGTVQRELIYVAKTIHNEGAIPSGVLRLAAPLSNVKEPADRLKNSLLLFLVFTSLATAFLTYILIRRLNRPIQVMIDTAEAIGTKDYKRRIHASPGHEFYPLIQSINKMAESIESHIQTITNQKQELEAVFNAMQEGVMVLDSRGKIQNINRTFAGLISHVPEVKGRRPLEVIVNVELQKLCDQVMASPAAEAEARPYNLQIALRENLTYDVNIVKVSDQQKEIGAVVVFHDISEIKRLEKVRQDFVANVSHELRTPLTSIKGYAETLLSETPSDPDTARSFLQVILKNANHMVKMVEDLLQLARLEAHGKLVKPVPVNASGALLTAWKACAPNAEAKGIRLENRLPAGGILVFADFDQLVQVFRNLLENAIRYSPPDEPLTVSCETRKNKATFGVRDEGPGIARQYQKRIFERFYRVEKPRSDHWGSTGLGLAICRHIIRNHGGMIWVQSPNSEGRKGATFFFTLSTAPEEQDAPEAPESSTLTS